MPELPEVETMARALGRRVRGKKVVGVQVRRPDVLRGATPASLRKALTGRRIDRVWRRAKLIVLDFDSGARVAVQPRFTGSLEVGPTADTPDPYSTLQIDLDDSRSVHYRDVRRLGTVQLFSPRAFDEYESRLGVEPLSPEFTADRLRELLSKSSRAVKAFIMDQYKIAGVGNIYASEALWYAGVSPRRAARRVRRAEAAALRDAIVEVLARAIDARGTTIRDYRGGGFASQLAAYGRRAEPCRRCGAAIVMTHEIDGRATYYCPRCQR